MEDTSDEDIGILWICADADDQTLCATDMPLLTAEEEEEMKKTCTVPKEYWDLLPVFSPRAAATLAPHRPGVNIKIKLQPGTTRPHGKVIQLSPKERDVLPNWIKAELAKGFIQPSSSSGGAPVLFAKKKYGSLRLCHNFRGPNSITLKDRYPLPNISTLLDQVQGSKIFTKLDPKSTYNLVRIHTGDEWKTAFKTEYGLHEMCVMPFGLSNAPACFQQHIESVLQPHLDVDTSAYLDDILTHHTTLEEHIPAVRDILQRLWDAGLYINLPKSEFHKPKVPHLGFILSGSELRMDPEKLATVETWPRPAKLEQVQSFLGFTNYDRHFVSHYARIARPLNALTQKTEGPFKMSPQGIAAFKQLRDAVLSAPILQQFNQNAKTTVITNRTTRVDYTPWHISRGRWKWRNATTALVTKRPSPLSRRSRLFGTGLLARLIKSYSSATTRTSLLS